MARLNRRMFLKGGAAGLFGVVTLGGLPPGLLRAAVLTQEESEAEEIAAIIAHISAHTKYPIANFDALTKALGGRKGRVRLRGRSFALAHAQLVLPELFFPVVSKRDLLTKVNLLRAELKAAKPLHMKPLHATRPDVSADELAKLPRDAQRHVTIAKARTTRNR